MAQLPEQKGQRTTKEEDAQNTPPLDPMERFRDAFAELVPDVDLGTVLRDSVRVEVEMGVARLTWSGFKRITPEQAITLYEALRRV